MCEKESREIETNLYKFHGLGELYCQESPETNTNTTPVNQRSSAGIRPNPDGSSFKNPNLIPTQ